MGSETSMVAFITSDAELIAPHEENEAIESLLVSATLKVILVWDSLQRTASFAGGI